MEYLYDFGAEWEHLITLTGHAEESTSTDTIECLDGKGDPIPETEDGYVSDGDEVPFEWNKSTVNESLAKIDERIRLEEMLDMKLLRYQSGT